MHKLLTNQPGERMLLLGNEAIARGAIEAGVAFTSTYPGTPSSELSLNFFQISKESDLYFEYSTNEKVSVEVAAAAAACGVRSMAMMKHVGLNVAADALMTLAYVGVKGGMVILTADDPAMFSSQNEQDNRYYAKLSGLPMLEPSTVDEARAIVAYAFDLSEKLQEPVLLRTTTRINHSSGVVTLGEIRPRRTKGSFTKDPLNLVPVPAVARKLHVKLLQNLAKARELSEQSPYNIVEGRGRWGILCNGVSYNYVKDAVAELKIADQVTDPAHRLLASAAGADDPELPQGVREGPGGGGRRTLSRRERQDLRAGSRADAPHPRQGAGSLLAALRIRPGHGPEAYRRLLRAVLHGAGAGRSFRCAAAASETADPVRGLFASGHLLRGPQGGRGPATPFTRATSAATPSGCCRRSPWRTTCSAWDLPPGPSGGFPRPATARSSPSSGTPPFSTPESPVWSTRSSTTTT